MKKTIVKAKLPSRTDFVSALEEIDFKFAAPYWQHDRIFVPRNFDRSKTQPRLSLRTITLARTKTSSATQPLVSNKKSALLKGAVFVDILVPAAGLEPVHP